MASFDGHGGYPIAQLRAFLKPPENLLARVRWLFLLISIIATVLTVPPLFAATTVWPLQAAALAGILWLVWHWVRGYRNGVFPRAGDVFEGLAVLVVCLAIDTPLHALGLVYNGLVFRSLYGNRRDVVVVALTYVGAFLGAVVFSLLVSGSGISVTEFLPHVLGLTLLSGVFHVLATTLKKHERASTRERILREAGAALVAALDRESIYKATLDAALDLTIENPKVRVGIAIGSEEKMTVVASAGYRAAEIRGDPLNICVLPEHLHTRLLERQPTEVEHDEDGHLRKALGLASDGRSFFMTPLIIEEELKGAIGVTSESSLSAESKDGLEALSFQVALALESVMFAEDRHWRQSEMRFRSLIQNSSDIIMVLGADGAINYVSPSVRRMLGYAPEDLVGKYNFALLHPDDVARVRRFHDKATSTPGAAPALEARLRHLDGSWRYIEGIGNNLLDDPEVRGIVINMRDITERKRAEEESHLLRTIALEVSETEDLDSALRITLQRVCETTNWAIGQAWIPNADGTVLECSPAWYAGANDLAGFRTANENFEFEPGVGLPRLAWSTRQPVWTRNITIEAKLPRAPIAAEFGLKAGMDIPVLVDSEVVAVLDFFVFEHREEDERLIKLIAGIAAQLGSVIQRKRAERALRQSEANLAEAQKIAHLGSWSVEPPKPGMPRERRGMHWSDEMYRIFGFAPQEFVPNSESPIESIHPQDRERVRRALQDSISRGEPSLTIEHRVIRPDGEVRFVQAQMENVFDEDGELLRRFGTVLDITDRKQAEEALRLSESRLLAAQRIAHVGNWTFDVINNEAHWSDEMYRIFGLEPQEEPALTYKGFLQRVHPDDRRLIQEASREALRGEVRSRLDYRAVRPDGEVRFVHSQYEVEYDASGWVVGLIGTLQDITEQKRAEEELRRSEERFRSLVQNSLDVVTVVDANATVLYYSPSVESVMGYKPEEFIGKNALEASPIHPDDLPRVRDIFGYLVENPGVNYSMELRMRHADGSWRVIEATANNLLDNPSVGGIVVNYRDITERKVFEKQLEHQALHDDLTGLPNRALFMNRLEHALARVDRLEGKVAVLFLDLDNFKVVNDGLGHKAGDELLATVARRLQGCLRSGDTVARLSGDEFIVLLEEIARESDATQLAERFAGQLRAPFRLGDQDVYVTTSIGVAFGTSSNDHPDELLRKADVAMYRAKSKGKAHCKAFDAYMDAEARERLRLETDLRQAIERQEFRVYYQPKVLLETGEIFDFEALVRWEHPERGLLLPSEFIPIAEESGLIHQIGRWVLRESCRQVREWREQKLSETPIPVCVNLSAKQFQHPDLAQDIVRILQETGVVERLLCLEITESVAMEEVQYTIATLNNLKGLNIRLAIDDFGTGYSSLSYLKNFPVDYLKIDRSIVTGFEKDSRNRAIVLSAITLAHALGLQVVAEGVESAGEFEKLRSLSCDLGQGYYFAHPLPAEAVPSLLARRSTTR